MGFRLRQPGGGLRCNRPRSSLGGIGQFQTDRALRREERIERGRFGNPETLDGIVESEIGPDSRAVILLAERGVQVQHFGMQQLVRLNPEGPEP
jgi:hypothetical protein